MVRQYPVFIRHDRQYYTLKKTETVSAYYDNWKILIRMQHQTTIYSNWMLSIPYSQISI